MMMKLLAAVSLLTATVAAADPHADAKAHVARATALHKDREFAKALDELKTAYALDPSPPLLYAMGQMLVALDRCDEAISYYERFIASHPAPEAVALATEAIEICKQAPPPTAADSAPPPPREIPSLPATALAPPPPPPRPIPRLVESSHRDAPWYADRVGDGLVAGGLAAGIAAAIVYGGARSDRASADGAMDYGAYGSMIDRAHDLRTGAIVGASIATSLVVAGVVHLVLHHHHHAAVTE